MTGTFHLQDFLFDVLASNEHVTLALQRSTRGSDLRFYEYMLAARSIAFSAVSASAVSAASRELAIAPAPSEAAHARNEPLGWCARRTCRARASEPTMLMTLPRAVRRRAIARSRGTRRGSERGTQMGCALPALLRHACSIAREGRRAWFTPFWLLNIKRV